MKIKIYLRVAKTPKGNYKVASSTKINHRPFDNGSSWGKKYYPTISFALILNIPDDAFNKASEVVAELNILEEKLEINAEIK